MIVNMILLCELSLSTRSCVMNHDADFQVLWSLLVQGSAVLLVVVCTMVNFTESGKDSVTAATYGKLFLRLCSW